MHKYSVDLNNPVEGDYLVLLDGSVRMYSNKRWWSWYDGSHKESKAFIQSTPTEPKMPTKWQIWYRSDLREIHWFDGEKVIVIARDADGPHES